MPLLLGCPATFAAGRENRKRAAAPASAGVIGSGPDAPGSVWIQPDSGIAKGSWSEIFRNGLGLCSALVIGGIAMNATQMLVIAIIMPLPRHGHERTFLTAETS